MLRCFLFIMLLGHGIMFYCSCEFYQKMHKNLERKWLRISFKIQYGTLTRTNKRFRKSY